MDWELLLASEWSLLASNAEQAEKGVSLGAQVSVGRPKLYRELPVLPS